MRADEPNNFTEEAREAYSSYAATLGITEAWERLSNREQAAWLGVVGAVLDSGRCSDCGAYLACPECDADEAEEDSEAETVPMLAHAAGSPSASSTKERSK